MDLKPGQSGPLQVTPRGMLGFFQLKSPAGQNPGVLEAALQPVVDLTDWYLQTNTEVNAQGANTITLGTGNQGFIPYATGLVVPQNEYWRVHHYSIQSGVLAVGDSGSFQCGFRQLPVAIQRQWALGDPVSYGTPAVVAGDRLIANARDFWVAPGDELGVWINRLVAAVSTSFTGYIRYSRCLV